MKLLLLHCRIFVLLSIIAPITGFGGTEHLKKAKTIDAQLRASNFSGEVILSCGNKTYLNKSYGPRAKKIHGKYFDIGSITKQFTAAAIMKLSVDGKLKLSDPVSKWLSPLPKALKGLTVEELVTHRSGLRYPPEEPKQEAKTEEPFIPQLEPEEQKMPPDTLQNFRLAMLEGIKETKIVKRPAAFEYFNMNYNILAYIVRAASGKPFNTYLKEELLDPNEIACGFNDHKSIPRKQAVQGHMRGRKVQYAGYYSDGYFLRGTSGIVCKAEDLRKWYHAQPKIFPDKKVLQHVRYLKGSKLSAGKKGYSFGLFYDGAMISHSGSTQGFSSESAHNPLTKCTAISLSDEENDRMVDYPIFAWYASSKGNTLSADADNNLLNSEGKQ